MAYAVPSLVELERGIGKALEFLIVTLVRSDSFLLSKVFFDAFKVYCKFQE